MKKINILQVVGSMNRGGAETFLMNVLRNIDKEKFNFIFLCYDDSIFDYEAEITSLSGKIVRTADVKKVGTLKHVQNIETIIKDEGIDIVHAHTYYNSIFSIVAAKRAGVKVRIAHSHNTKSEEFPSLPKRLYFMVSKFIINRYSTSYIACGHDAGAALFYKENKFTIVDNGIILDDFYYDPAVRNRLRKELNIPQDYTVIMHIGRFDKQKNHSFLIDIYNEYLKKHAKSQLILIGDGVLRASIEQKVLGLGIQEHVMFLGKRGDVKDLYNTADLFLFPSLYEGLPVTLVEAQANGLACLISDTIDKTIKITNCIHFQPLTDNTIEWTEKLDMLDLSRISTRTTLENGDYDMVKNVKKIEHLYINTLTSKEIS